MRTLLKISDALERVCAYASRMGSWLLLALIIIIVFDVVTRKFMFIRQFVDSAPFGDLFSPTKLQELEWHLHAVIFLMSFGLAYLNGTHVRVDLWREGRKERTRAWLELAALCVFALPYCGVLVFYSWDFVVTSYQQGEGSPAMTGIPNRWIIKSFLLAGVTLLLAALVSTAIRLVIYLGCSGSGKSIARDRLVMLTSGKSADVPEEGTSA